MIRHKFFFGLLLCGCMSAFVSCDNISEEDRFIPIEKGDEPAPEPSDVVKKVLIQEFSGIQCSNCPIGARLLHSLQESYPDRFVVVCLQPTGVAQANPIGTFTLANDLAKMYYDSFGVKGLPTAVIDGGQVLADSRTWATPAIDALDAPAPVDITLTTAYDQASRELTVNYETDFVESYGQDASILVWVVENGIIGPQIDKEASPQLVKEYEHNHIFRTSANGNWGSSLGVVFQVGDKKSGSVKVTLDQNWKAENCEVVAFVFNTATRATLQAETAHVVNK